MAKKGLTKEKIVDAAMAQIETGGLAAFSLRNLAAALQVQVSSLYNHVSGQSALLEAVGLRAVELLVRAEEDAVAGKQAEEALWALAEAYRGYAMAHPELYRLLVGVHHLRLPQVEAASAQIVRPMLRVIADFGVAGTLQIHYQRMLRRMMHGFFALSSGSGFFSSPGDREESYRISIAAMAAQLRAAGGNTDENQ